ncbi:hypothetical protein E1B28_012868 [Marasmius oreades]|uniref:Uncharacterized protein n=1 Tax=Marasmius oreades TaxID=181124 RepID=A0A9P7UR94_9AGAR|nr:uncharacterized protein E1B28_012868 [Marasmius oreades]KAG7088924.1 hypothetical protein E1B28_012868 [Marasmius oreades]
MFLLLGASAAQAHFTSVVPAAPQKGTPEDALNQSSQERFTRLVIAGEEESITSSLVGVGKSTHFFIVPDGLSTASSHTMMIMMVMVDRRMIICGIIVMMVMNRLPATSVVDHIPVNV